MHDMDRKYMSVRKVIDRVPIEAVVKFDDEGVFIDLWWDGMIVQRTRKLYSELPVTLDLED